MAKLKDLQVNIKTKVTPQEEDKIKMSFTRSLTGAVKTAFGGAGKAMGAFTNFNMGVKAFGDNVANFVGGIMKYEELVNKQASKADQRLKLLDSLADTKAEQVGFMKLMSGFTGAGLSPEEVEKALSKFRESVASGKFKGTKIEGMNTMDMFMEFITQVGKMEGQQRQQYIAEFIGTKQVSLFEDLLGSSASALENYNKMSSEEALKQIANMRALADQEDKKDAMRYQTDIKREEIIVKQGLGDASVENERTRLDRETRALANRTGQDLIAAQNAVNFLQEKQDKLQASIMSGITTALQSGDIKDAIKTMAKEVFNEVLQGPEITKWITETFTNMFKKIGTDIKAWATKWSAGWPSWLKIGS